MPLEAHKEIGPCTPSTRSRFSAAGPAGEPRVPVAKKGRSGQRGVVHPLGWATGPFGRVKIGTFCLFFTASQACRIRFTLAHAEQAHATFPRRDVAQPGRALAWGARGRQFKSARPDHSFSLPLSRPQFGSTWGPRVGGMRTLVTHFRPRFLLRRVQIRAILSYSYPLALNPISSEVCT